MNSDYDRASFLGALSHIEIYVSDLRRSEEFWGWLLPLLGYVLFQNWAGGRSWKRGEFYIVLVQVDESKQIPYYHRQRVGLNHLAFLVDTRQQVDELTSALTGRGVVILYDDRHPFAGGTDHYAVYFEDPDRIKVEVVSRE